MAQKYKFCFGPGNIGEGADCCGPAIRPPLPFDWKLAQLKKLGFDAMTFHDDDVVPNLDDKSESQIRKETREMKRKLDGEGIATEMIAPRLWFSPNTVDGAYTSNNPKHRQYAIDRSLRSIDMARMMGATLVVIWLGREGTYVRESKNTRRCVELIVHALDQMLAHDKRVRLAIEPKANEPMDHTFVPTVGHVLAVAGMTQDSRRVGTVIETSHCVMTGLDPADEMAFALAFGKLWSLHLNDQNGVKFDQDKPFGSANLRRAFDQVRVIEQNKYGSNGEYVCFDVQPFRTTKPEHLPAHLDNSRRTFLRLVQKARTFNESKARQMIADRNYQALDQYVIEHLLGK